MRKAIGVDATHAKVGEDFAYTALAIFKEMSSSGIMALWYSDLITIKTMTCLVCKDRLPHEMLLSSMLLMGVHVFQNVSSNAMLYLHTNSRPVPGTIHHANCQGHAQPHFISVRSWPSVRKRTS